MISLDEEYRKLVIRRLEENHKSFDILFELKNYGNCISILCQELDQYIHMLYLLKQPQDIRDRYIANSINDQKWYSLSADNKKKYVTDEDIDNFAMTLNGWELGIFHFKKAFNDISKNFNYMLKDPIKGLDRCEKNVIFRYIKEYHDPSFSTEYTISEFIPKLPMVFKKVADSIHRYFND